MEASIGSPLGSSIGSLSEDMGHHDKVEHSNPGLAAETTEPGDISLDLDFDTKAAQQSGTGSGSAMDAFSTLDAQTEALLARTDALTGQHDQRDNYDEELSVRGQSFDDQMQALLASTGK